MDLLYWNNINTGQVKLNQGIGRWITKYAKDLRYKKFLEIGTWNGRGSTVCFAYGFKSRTDNPEFLSLETNEDLYKQSSEFWRDDLNIKIRHCRIFKDNELPTLDIVQSIHSDINKDWHEQDINNFKSASYIEVSPDVVLLDGGEYMTYFEYLKLKDTAKVFILDDTSAAKCKKIVEELSQNSEWKLIDKDPNERNGWHVFERLQISS